MFSLCGEMEPLRDAADPVVCFTITRVSPLFGQQLLVHVASTADEDIFRTVNISAVPPDTPFHRLSLRPRRVKADSLSKLLIAMELRQLDTRTEAVRSRNMPDNSSPGDTANQSSCIAPQLHTRSRLNLAVGNSLSGCPLGSPP
jgi:hypothetical protein